MFDKISVLSLLVLIISIGTLIFILNSNYTPAYLLAYGVLISIVSGFALLAFVLAVKNN